MSELKKRKLSAAQCREMSLELRKVGHQLSQYQIDHWDELTEAKRKQVANLEATYYNNADDFIALAIAIEVEDLSEELQSIKDAIQSIESTLKTVASIKNVIKVATAGVTLTAAVISGNASAIAQELANVGEAIATLANG